MVEITLMQKIELAYSFTNKQKISTLRDLTFVSFNFIFSHFQIPKYNLYLGTKWAF